MKTKLMFAVMSCLLLPTLCESRVCANRLYHRTVGRTIPQV